MRLRRGISEPRRSRFCDAHCHTTALSVHATQHDAHRPAIAVAAPWLYPMARIETVVVRRPLKRLFFLLGSGSAVARVPSLLASCAPLMKWRMEVTDKFANP